MAMLADTVGGVIGSTPPRHPGRRSAHAVGGLIAATQTTADAQGYRALLNFAQVQVPGRRCWAVEGAGSYGAGLAWCLLECGERVVEICRPKRPASRTGAKTDAGDAIRAAKEALALEHPAAPRQRGHREALRCCWPPAGVPSPLGWTPATSPRR